ncbi:hypothetical protein J4772_10780 [Cohnella sp. LGH]|uniref:hypothetical protein n=1 Tax=Cohnella sp. LGH TaxID=1619153 RepID=UPI001ADC4B93|nr:hypothetical protein [Cohnella sp. LGH]QTH44834.1 hypothetical protein J4772_10780 [Cohnella sp. LGH]
MHSKKSRFRTLITLLIALIFVISSLQLVSADNSNMDLSQQPVKPVLPLTSSQELQLSIEQQYNDVVLSVISEHFGSLESLYEYGFFKIENNNDGFKYVFLFSKNNDITDHFIKAISSAVPIHLLKFKSVNKSHAELVKIQQEVDTTLFKSDLSNFISSYIDDDNQKIIVEVKNEEMAKYLFQHNPKMSNLFKQTCRQNQCLHGTLTLQH